MSTEAQLCSPIIFSGEYRSEGLVKLPTGALLVSKGHDIHHVTPNWEVSRWTGRWDNGPRDADPSFKFPFICGMCLVNDTQLYLGCEIDYTIMLVEDGTVIRYAGTGQLGKQDGFRLQASFGFPGQIAHLNGFLYITDYYHVIRRIDLESGMVTSIGSGNDGSKGLLDGFSSVATFGRPSSLITTKAGLIMICDTHSIRTYDPMTGIITTLAGSNEKGFADAAEGKDARFGYPSGICELPNGEFLISDSTNNRIRIMSPYMPYQVHTFLGDGIKGRDDGPISQARLSNPSTIILQDNGNLVLTEKYGLRVIKNFTGISEFSNDFSSFLKPDPWSSSELSIVQALSDFHWTLPASEKLVHLHSAILAASLRPHDLQAAFHRISSLGFDEADYLTFCEMLYGHTPTEFQFYEPSPPSRQNSPRESYEASFEMLYGPQEALSPNPSMHGQSGQSDQPGTSASPLTHVRPHGVSPFSPEKQELLTSLMRQILIASEFKASTLCKWLQSRFHSCMADLYRIEHIEALLQSEEAVMDGTQLIKFCVMRRYRKAMISDQTPLVLGTAENLSKLPPFKVHRKKVKSPPFIIQRHLSRLASSLSFTVGAQSDSIGASSENQPNISSFELVLGGGGGGAASGPSQAIKVSDCLLFMRWPYFRRLLQAGMAESTNRRAELPSEFSPSLLMALMQFIYGMSVHEQCWSLSPSDADFILENAPEFGLADLDGVPFLGFAPFLSQCQYIKSKQK